MRQSAAVTPGKMMLIGTGWFGVQVFWAFHAGTMPLFLKGFTDSKFTISLVLSLAGLSGCLVPPLVGTWSDRSTSRFGRRRPFVLLGSLAALLCVLGLPRVHDFGAVALLAACMYFALRAAETPYLSLLPDITPPEQRSTASGVMNLVGSLGLIGCFAMNTVLWEHHPRVVFQLVALVFFGSLLLAIALLKEPAYPGETPRERAGPLRYLRSIIAETSALRFYTAQFFWWLGFWMVTSFATLFAVEELGVAEGRSFLVLLPFTVVATICMLPLGMLGDRFGRKAILSGMIFAWAISQVLVGFSQNLAQAVVLVAISAIPFAAVMGVGFAFMLDLVPEDRTAEFVGFSVISIAVAQILGPLLGGTLIDAMGYRSIFPAAAMLMIIGLVILRFVEPRAGPGAGLQVHVALRVGDRAARCLELFLDPAREVEAQGPVVGAGAPGADHQVHRGVAQLAHGHDGFRIAEHPRVAGEDLADRLDRPADVVVVGDSDREVVAARVVRRVVLQRAAVDGGVGDRDLHVVRRVQHAREDPDLLHRAGGARHLDVIADLEGAEDQEHHSRREVREGALHGQADGEACGGEDGDHRGGLDPEEVQDRDHHHGQRQVVDQARQEGHQRLVDRRAFERAARRAAHGSADDATDDEKRDGPDDPEAPGGYQRDEGRNEILVDLHDGPPRGVNSHGGFDVASFPSPAGYATLVDRASWQV